MKKPRRPQREMLRAAQLSNVVPPVLPLIVFEEHDDQQLLLTVNGDRSRARWVHRNEMGQIITELSHRFGTATRVEVHQRDGHIRADLLPQAPAPAPGLDVGQQPINATPLPEPAPVPDLLEFSASGFLAGEEVTLSIVVQETAANASGVARILIDRAVPPEPRSQIILRGSISGATSIQPFA